MKTKNSGLNRQSLVHYFCMEVKKKECIKDQAKSITLQKVPWNGEEIIRGAEQF